MAGIGTTADPAKYQEAIDSFRRKVPVTDAEWDTLNENERRYAFKVSGVAQVDLVTDVFEGIDKAIEDGTPFADFQAEFGDQLAEAWGGESPARVETIFRTSIQQAYSGGRDAILNDPVVKEARPYWRFDAVQDDRTTEECDEANGTVLPADDPWWDSNSPPLHFNCRSQKVALTEDEAKEEGIDEEGPDVQLDEGFGQPQPPAGGGDWSPSMRDYPEAIAQILADRLDAGAE